MSGRGKLMVSLCSDLEKVINNNVNTTVVEQVSDISVNIESDCASLVEEKSTNINVSIEGNFECATGCDETLGNLTLSTDTLEEGFEKSGNIEGYDDTGYEKYSVRPNVSFVDQSSSVTTETLLETEENVEICSSQAQLFVINKSDGSLTPLISSDDVIQNINLETPIDIVSNMDDIGLKINLEPSETVADQGLVDIVSNMDDIGLIINLEPSETVADQGLVESVGQTDILPNNIDCAALLSHDHIYFRPEQASCSVDMDIRPNPPDFVVGLELEVGTDIEQASNTVIKHTSHLSCTVPAVSLFTKEGNLRKRKKFNLSVVERKKAKIMEVAEAHHVKPACTEKCKLKCSTQIATNRQIEINKQYWELGSVQERKTFVLNAVSKMEVKRKTSGPESRRTCTNEYYLKTDDGTSTKVCKVFFLATLGYSKNNDKILQNLSKQKDQISPRADRRKGKIPANKADHDAIIEHIESFEPKISHYRREHAPNRRYLPSDLSITYMHKDYLKKYPATKISYDLYRSEVAKLNISFVKLGNEECEQCEHFNLHGHTKDDLQENCKVCHIWNIHIVKANEARTEYKNDAEKGSTDNRVVYSVDMEKVIMLPRCEMFKSVIFTKRLTVYNESFVPVGKKHNLSSVACLWHDAIRGRNKEELISTIYKFLLTTCRDVKNVVLWMDNCSAQNKNWALYSFLIYIVNCNEICAETIEVKYFEPGHTFMSCDSFHHLVEKSLHRMKKVYDFGDFQQAVQSSSSKANTIEMATSDFFQWKDHSAKRVPNQGKKNGTPNTRIKRGRKQNSLKLNDCTENEKKKNPEKGNRPFLRDVVHLQARRGLFHLLYKPSFNDEWEELHFLTPTALKSGLKLPPCHSSPVGISTARKNSILNNLLKSQKGIVPPNRFLFWENLPVNSDES